MHRRHTKAIVPISAVLISRFCLLAIDWGWSLEDTCQRLMEKGSKARENGLRYGRLTAQHAAAAIHRRNLNHANQW